jgi:ankyrin repeat protein
MMTPLHCCAEYDQTSTAELVLKYAESDNSSFIDAKDRYGWTALMTAVNNGAAAVTSLLLRQGADVNATNKQGRSALHIAAAQNRAEICENLLEAGADVNAEDSNGMTAAHVAAMFGNMAVYTLLTSQAQFNVDSADSLEHTPKEYLAV